MPSNLSTIGGQGSLVISNVRLPFSDNDAAAKLWKVECRDGHVSSISPYTEVLHTASSSEFDAKGSLMLPSLCHSHIHLDKCFIMDKCGDLVNGDFSEAMRITGKAKASFPLDPSDLYNRGARVIRESVENGVTSMRAHVEVDTIVQFACLDAALLLRHAFRKVCDVQIAVFSQEALFSASGDTAPGPNYSLLKKAAGIDGVSVIGSAPYVEPSVEQAKRNIELIFGIAGSASMKAIDFHLDYNLDPKSEPLIFDVVDQAKIFWGRYYPNDTSHRPHVSIGHATRLLLFSPPEWRGLAELINGLPITLISLPQSDMYMQGRADQDKPFGPPRSTLRVPYIAKTYGIQAAMSVNNVENAFTPQGSLDPLSLCSFGAAIFQVIAPEDIRTLARSVTLTSKVAIGQSQISAELYPSVGDVADFVIIHGRSTLRAAVVNPSFDRTTIFGGNIVGTKRSTSWLLGDV